VIASLVCLFVAPAAVTLAPVEFRRFPTLPEMVKDESREYLVKESQIGFTAAAKKQGIEVIFDPAATSPKIRVESIDQKNYDRRAILSNPNRGASLTKVDVTFMADGIERKLKGEAEAGYFGTQNKRDLSGTPEMKSYAIQLVNQDRARAIGKAIFEATKNEIPRQ